MTWAALAAVTGILFAQLRPSLWLVGLLLTSLLFPWPRAWRPFGWLALTALCFAALHRISSLPGEHLPAILAQAHSQSLPVRFSGAIQGELPGGGFEFHLTALSQGTVSVVTDNLILLQVPSRRIHPGQSLSGTGRLSALPGPRNPGERPRWRSLQAQIHAASFHHLQPAKPSLRLHAERFASECREWIGGAITRGIPPGSESAGLIQAMVLGIREGTTYETEEAFRKSGAMHLFSVSGLHVAIFASVIWSLLRPFPVSRLQTVFTIAGTAFFYAFITGLAPPSIRAAVMLSVVLFGFALRREARILNSLGFAALLIFAADTRQLFDIGFQLSFSVMAAIALLCPFFERLTHRWFSADPFIPRVLLSRQKRRWESAGRSFASLLSLSLAAWIGSIPLSLWYFGLLTPYSVLANCLLVPMSWVIMALSTFSLGLSLPHIPWIPVWANQLNGHCATLLQMVASFFAHLPGAAVELPPIGQAFSSPGRAQPSLVVFDLQESCAPQAIVLPRLAGQAQPPLWIVDPGNPSGYRQVVRPWLRAQHVRELEGLLLSHGDVNHIEAAPSLLADFTVRRVVFSPLKGRSPVWNRLRTLPLPSRQIRLDLAAGSRLNLADGVDLRILFPPPAYPNQAQADDECLVFLLEWSGWRILSLADSGFATEKWLLEHEPGLRCDVLIRSRHRTDASGLPEFLRQLQVRCLISTNHSFPASECLTDAFREELAVLGIPLFDLALTGAVTLTPRTDQLKIAPCCRGETLILREKTP